MALHGDSGPVNDSQTWLLDRTHRCSLTHNHVRISTGNKISGDEISQNIWDTNLNDPQCWLSESIRRSTIKIFPRWHKFCYDHAYGTLLVMLKESILLFDKHPAQSF